MGIWREENLCASRQGALAQLLWRAIRHSGVKSRVSSLPRIYLEEPASTYVQGAMPKDVHSSIAYNRGKKWKQLEFPSARYLIKDCHIQGDIKQLQGIIVCILTPSVRRREAAFVHTAGKKLRTLKISNHS